MNNNYLKLEKIPLERSLQTEANNDKLNCLVQPLYFSKLQNCEYCISAGHINSSTASSFIAAFRTVVVHKASRAPKVSYSFRLYIPDMKAVKTANDFQNIKL